MEQTKHTLTSDNTDGGCQKQGYVQTPVHCFTSITGIGILCLILPLVFSYIYTSWNNQIVEF